MVTYTAHEWTPARFPSGVPVADPLTFDRRSYTTPEALDGVEPNMNRVWPGDADGTLHERLAAALWEVASGADVLVDLHTASAATLPHVVYTAGDRLAGIAVPIGA